MRQQTTSTQRRRRLQYFLFGGIAASLLGLQLSAFLKPDSCVAGVRQEEWQQDFAFLVKTGSLTAQSRVPIQLLTFLSGIRNFILVGAQEDAAGHFKVADVATSAIQHIRKFHASQHVSRALAWKPENQTVGYVLDRYKNIPGWGALYDAFPTAAWYIAIDDDAYWVQSSFRSFISQFDPDQPHYLGNPFGFDPSRNAHTGDQFEGGQMPHGGEGMILSRRAMHLMMQHLPECIERVIEGDFLFGDVQTTLCLRLAGVVFNETALAFNTLMMNHPPGLPDFDRGDDWENRQRGLAVQWPQQHPCAKVFAIHHLRPEQMQRVFELEAAAPGRMPCYADFWWGLRSQNTSLIANAELLQLSGISTAGTLLHSTVVTREEDCRGRCESQVECLQYTFRSSSRLCETRSAYDRVVVAAEGQQDQMLSGALLDRLACGARAAL